MIERMEIIVMTISNTFTDFRICLLNEWVIEFILFNNIIIILLIKKGFIETKNAFQ